MLEGKELEGSIGSNNGEPIVKYSVDIDDKGIVDVQVSASLKIDLLEELGKVASKTSIGQKVMDFLNKIKGG